MGKPVVQFEIGCRDRQKTEHSTPLDSTDPSSRRVRHPLSARVTAGGIGGHITSLGHEPHHYPMSYVEVDDIAGYLKKA